EPGSGGGDRLDLEPLDPRIAQVRHRRRDADLLVELDALVLRGERRDVELELAVEELRLEPDLEGFDLLRPERRRDGQRVRQARRPPPRTIAARPREVAHHALARVDLDPGLGREVVELL